MWNKLTLIASIVVAMPALAQAMPQTQDEWYVDGGRYVDGQVPYYNQEQSNHQVRSTIMSIEGDNSATIGTRSNAAAPQGDFWSSRDQLVSVPGN